MPLYTGTQDAADLLLVKTGTALAYGLDRIAATVQAEIAAQSLAIRTAIAAVATLTTERSTVYGGGTAGEAQKVDEYGRAATQKPGDPSPVNFPLDKYQYPVGYTANFLKTRTPADVVMVTLSATQALGIAVRKEIRLAFFGAANRSVRDNLVDRQLLTVRALVNADGSPVPTGPNGEEFDPATHTHYDAAAWAGLTAVQRAAVLDAAILDVVEHGHGEGLTIAINRQQEGDFAAIPGFVANVPAVVVVGTGTVSTVTPLDVTRIDNRSVGYYKGAEVVTRTWVPPMYLAVYAAGSASKPLAFRERADEVSQGFQLAGTNVAHQLQADFMEYDFGIGALTRTNGAAVYLGGAAYLSPTS